MTVNKISPRYEANKKYREKHSEVIKNHREKNKEKYVIYQRIYKEKNKEQIKEKQVEVGKKYRKKNKEKISIKAKKNYLLRKFKQEEQKMNKMELYNEWQRLSKLAKVAHDNFDKAHHQYYHSGVSTGTSFDLMTETKQRLIKLRMETGEIYDKYEAA